MRFRNVRIIANPNKPWALESSTQLTDYLEGAGFSIVGTNADLTVCIGGDGTILYANHSRQLAGTVLGIGGERSVICQLTKHNWKKKILQILREGKTENRQLLFASTREQSHTAINDFVVHCKDYRVIEIDIDLDGHHHHFEGDGIIVSSATGSYAYAYSAGGKRLRPRSKRIQVVPICPYKREFRPHVLPSNSIVQIKVDRESGFIVDGVFIRDLEPGEIVTVKSGGFVKFLSK